MASFFLRYYFYCLFLASDFLTDCDFNLYNCYAYFLLDDVVEHKYSLKRFRREKKIEATVVFNHIHIYTFMYTFKYISYI